jgi:hypothetical protein
MAFVSDTLQHPPKPGSPHTSRFKRKRLIGCLETITYLLTRHIEKGRPDIHAWLNMMEILNCAHLNQEASRDYRMYQVWTHCTSDIDEIIILLLENNILTRCHDKYIYEEWFAERAMILLESLPQIHMEHSANGNSNGWAVSSSPA